MSAFVKVSKEHPRSGYGRAGSAAQRFRKRSPFRKYAPQVRALKWPSFCGVEFFGSCRKTRNFFRNLHRGSERSVNGHMIRGLDGARSSGWVPRGGKPVTAVPDCAITVSTQIENSVGNKPAL